MNAHTDLNSLPAGFRASAVAAGIKKPGRDDMILIAADVPAAVAGAFTKNRFVAAPVTWCRRVLERRSPVRAVVVNAGNANAGTGAAGLDDARSMAAQVAVGLRCAPLDVLVSSTGVIGRPLPMDRVANGIRTALTGLSGATSLETIARAIMTTDTVPKWSARRSGRATITGVIKGAGMIHPDMATMLCYLLTDAEVSSEELQRILDDAVPTTFNAISVDNDCSTNDSVIIMASGAAGAPDADFADQVADLCRELALKCVADGEGATRVVTISIGGAASREDAKLGADAIATSMLVKTAIHGADPNWGRILAALGRSGAAFDPERVEIRLQGMTVFAHGLPVTIELPMLESAMKQTNIEIALDLAAGAVDWTAYTSDLSEEYVAINADYTS